MLKRTVERVTQALTQHGHRHPDEPAYVAPNPDSFATIDDPVASGRRRHPGDGSAEGADAGHGANLGLGHGEGHGTLLEAGRGSTSEVAHGAPIDASSVTPPTDPGAVSKEVTRVGDPATPRATPEDRAAWEASRDVSPARFREAPRAMDPSRPQEIDGQMPKNVLATERCPTCHAEALPYLYGRLATDGTQAVGVGRALEGGCTFGLESPSHHCANGHDFLTAAERKEREALLALFRERK